MICTEQMSNITLIHQRIATRIAKLKPDTDPLPVDKNRMWKGNSLTLMRGHLPPLRQRELLFVLVGLLEGNLICSDILCHTILVYVNQGTYKMPTFNQ